MTTGMKRNTSPLATRKKASKPATPACRRPPLRLEALEAREVPAVAIQFDYSLDTTGFFNDPMKRAVLQQAADEISGHLTAPLAAIIPGGVNSFSLSVFSPADGRQVSVPNRAIPANTLVVYAGARNLNGIEAGIGGYGGYGAGGTQDWLNFLKARGVGGMTLWGGSMTFDADANWYTSLSGSASASQIDFYSVASHELGHLLGLGTAPAWFSQMSGGTFQGGNATAVYGGAVPLYGDGAHWADGLTVADGTRASLDPILQSGARVGFSALDYAALADIGWGVGGPTAPPPVAQVPLGNDNITTDNFYTPPSSHGETGCSCAACRPVVLSGLVDGSAQSFGLNNGGELAVGGQRFTPFPGFTGIVRSVVGDFNGDGCDDFAFGTGAGVGAQIRIINGKDGSTLAGPTGVFDGFAGGLFLAANDIDGDGAAELAISADAGGGNRIGLFKVDGSGLHRLVDFMAFNDPNFRGGSRIAIGDVNHDGYGDLIVGAGVGGSPRVAVYSGTGLTAGMARTLIPDFFALDPNLRSGVFVSAADMNGDGYSDVIYSTGDTGGPRVRIVSGSTLSANPGRNADALPALADFFALDADDRNGIRLTARDLNGDNRAELIVAGGDRGNPLVRVFNASNLGSTSVPYIDPFTDPAIDGLYVG